MNDKVIENLKNDCLKFYDKYFTLNEFTIKKYNNSLYTRINKYYGSLEKMRETHKKLPKDNGARFWNYNNICLFKSPKFIPEELKNIPKVNFKFNKSDKIKSLNELHNFLKNFIFIHSDFLETKSGIQYYDSDSNPFHISIIIVQDCFRDKKFNNSDYAFTKYKKEFNNLNKKLNNVAIIEFYNNEILVKDVIKSFAYGGLNIYKEFNFISVDPPTSRNLGYSIMKYSNNKCTIIESGTFTMDNRAYRGGVLVQMKYFLSEMIEKHDCKYFISESAFGFGDVKVRTLLNENVGIFQLLSELYSMPFIPISPKQFKADVLRDFEATKEDTIEWAISKFGIEHEIIEHEADAIALGLCFLVKRELVDVLDYCKE